MDNAEHGRCRARCTRQQQTKEISGNYESRLTAVNFGSIYEKGLLALFTARVYIKWTWVGAVLNYNSTSSGDESGQAAWE